MCRPLTKLLVSSSYSAQLSARMASTIAAIIRVVREMIATLQKRSSQPGIEPGSEAPEAPVLPLHHWDLLMIEDANRNISWPLAGEIKCIAR